MGTSYLKDIHGDITTEGGLNSMNILDYTQRDILQLILIEMKKMNIYLSLITDNEIKENDIE